MNKICIVVTSPMSLYYFHKGLFKYLRKHNFGVFCVSAPGIELEWVSGEVESIHVIPFARRPSLIGDLKALFSLIKYFKCNKFNCIHLGTPKASFLGAIAATVTGQKNVVYTVHGRVYENCKGIKRFFYSRIDWLICKKARFVIPVSREMGNNLIMEKLCQSNKIQFLGNGSCNGVDTQFFSRNLVAESECDSFRKRLSISKNAVVVLFIGRIAFDKGVYDLLEAFSVISKSCSDTVLLFVGPIEDRVFLEKINKSGANNVKWIDSVKDPRSVYATSDIVVLPSYREGFPIVPLEAGAMGLPVIASDICGNREAVIHGETGLLFPPMNISSLSNAILALVMDKKLRLCLGAKGRRRVSEMYRPELIWDCLRSLYCQFCSNSPSTGFVSKK